jgi:CheY-like chemotaxis protein
VARRRTRKPKSAVVLIVEDEPTVLALAESIVAEMGYTTLSAANAREALALLNEEPSINVLFTDISMPDGADGMDGLELARRAAELRPALRVVYTTDGPLTDGMQALFVAGSSFLPKPYTREQLFEAMRGDSASADT